VAGARDSTKEMEMDAKVIKTFNGRPDDQVLTRTLSPGDIVTGDLAAVAVREKLAVEIKTRKGKKSPAEGEGGGAGPQDNPPV
jgi:hypothetical protein